MRTPPKVDPVLLDVWRIVAIEAHEAHPDHPSRQVLDGLGSPVFLRGAAQGTSRVSLVKFLPVDGELKNHGLGVDFFHAGLEIRSWAHGKGAAQMVFTVQPPPEQLGDMLRWLARWSGLLR